jgi:hypothetical protein
MPEKSKVVTSRKITIIKYKKVATFRIKGFTRNLPDILLYSLINLVKLASMEGPRTNVLSRLNFFKLKHSFFRAFINNLGTAKRTYTVLRSPHGHIGAREQFETRLYTYDINFSNYCKLVLRKRRGKLVKRTLMFNNMLYPMSSDICSSEFVLYGMKYEGYYTTIKQLRKNLLKAKEVKIPKKRGRPKKKI